MGRWRNFRRGVTEFADTMLRGATAKSPACSAGYVLDTATGGEVCVTDLVIDIKTGELVSPAEAQRRASGEMVWDETGTEWVTPDELQTRERRRASDARRDEREATRDAMLERRRTGADQWDPYAKEWVAAAEKTRRTTARNALVRRLAASGLAPRDLPSLPAIRRGLLEGGVVTDVELEPEVDEANQTVADQLRDLVNLPPGPVARAQEDKNRRLYIIMTLLIAIIGAVVLATTGMRRQGATK